MIRPVRYSGRSARNSQARANISAGPTTQLRKSEVPKKRRFATPCRSSGRAPRSGPSPAPGTSSPAGPSAIGSETVPTSSSSSHVVQARDQPAEQQAGRHRERDPERQEAVERRELPHHPRLRGRRRGRGRHRSGSGFSRRHRTGPRSMRPPRAGAPRRVDGGRRAARGRRSSRCVASRSRPGSSPPPSAP